jgi:hypothetical protein
MSKKNERIRGREKARIIRTLEHWHYIIARLNGEVNEPKDFFSWRRAAKEKALTEGSSGTPGAPSLPTKHTLSTGRERMSSGEMD